MNSLNIESIASTANKIFEGQDACGKWDNSYTLKKDFLKPQIDCSTRS